MAQSVWSQNQRTLSSESSRKRQSRPLCRMSGACWLVVRRSLEVDGLRFKVQRPSLGTFASSMDRPSFVEAARLLENKKTSCKTPFRLPITRGHFKVVWCSSKWNCLELTIYLGPQAPGSNLCCKTRHSDCLASPLKWVQVRQTQSTSQSLIDQT